MDPLIGTTIGQYQIQGLLGQGGMASVYRAIQPSLGREVAIKVMSDQQAAADDNFSERFRREAAAIARLRHPNILNIIDYGEAGKMAYIAMEYVPYGALRDVMSSTLPFPYVIEVVRQVASALDAAHELGIVHRDVKPANILFQDRGSLFDEVPPARERPPWVVLADFGIARSMSEQGLTRQGTGIGTPEYMSPEQARGLPVDGRSDIYALGIVLFELLTGNVPFSGQNSLQVVMQHVRDPLPPPRGLNSAIPEDVEQVIYTATAKRPEDRYQTAGAFAKALQMTLTSTPKSNPAIPAAPMASTPPSRHNGPNPSLASYGPEKKSFPIALLIVPALGIVFLLLAALVVVMLLR